MNDNVHLSVLAELKFIGSVKPDEFLNTKTGYTEQKNMFTSFIRYFRFPDEDGKKTAEFCRTVILKALALLEQYDKKQDNEIYREQILHYISNARDGIVNLKKTHSTNNLAYALFDTLEIRINSTLQRD